jgi:hypothetical protein
MTIHENILIMMKMLDEGIIPFSWPLRDLDASLSTLDSKEQKVAKRKFRKLWRKALKNMRNNEIYFKNMSKSCGIGLPPDKLTGQHRRTRAHLVYQLLKNRV